MKKPKLIVCIECGKLMSKLNGYFMTHRKNEIPTCDNCLKKIRDSYNNIGRNIQYNSVIRIKLK